MILRGHSGRSHLTNQDGPFTDNLIIHKDDNIMTTSPCKNAPAEWECQIQNNLRLERWILRVKIHLASGTANDVSATSHLYPAGGDHLVDGTVQVGDSSDDEKASHLDWELRESWAPSYYRLESRERKER